jgi:hypothetical protein
VLLEIKVKVFPNKFTDSRLRKPDKSVGSCGWKRDISTGLATEGKLERIPQGDGRKRARYVVVIVVIMIMMIITTCNTLAG